MRLLSAVAVSLLVTTSVAFAESSQLPKLRDIDLSTGTLGPVQCSSGYSAQLGVSNVAAHTVESARGKALAKFQKDANAACKSKSFGRSTITSSSVDVKLWTPQVSTQVVPKKPIYVAGGNADFCCAAARRSENGAGTN